MSLVQTLGQGIWYPAPPLNSTWSALGVAAGTAISATGNKVALCGRVWTPNRGALTIERVHFRFSGVTKTAGSGLVVSLQDLANTSVIKPDETQDQFRAIANAESTFAANTWYSSGLLTSDGTDNGTKRTVGWGDPLAIVFEFDSAGRLGSDTFAVAGLAGTAVGTHNLALVTKISGTWAATSSVPNVIIEFAGGLYGTLQSAHPISANSTHAFNSGSTPDEYAVEFSLPFPAKVDGWWAFINPAADTSDFDVVLYDETGTVLSSVSVEAGHAGAAAAIRPWTGYFPAEVTLAKNTVYRLAFKPTQAASNITLINFDVAAAAHLNVHQGGQAFKHASRTDGGTWTTTSTRRLAAGLRISSLDDGVVAAQAPAIGGTIEDALKSHLGAYVSEVNARVYGAGTLYQSAALPAVTFQRITSVPEYSHTSGRGLALSRFQIGVWAKTLDAARAVAASVRLAMDNFYVLNRPAIMLNETDLGHDTKSNLFSWMFEYAIYHRDTVA